MGTHRTDIGRHALVRESLPHLRRAQGQPVIVTGHHRSVAALIQGRPVLARVVARDPQPVSITPHLAISDHADIADDDTASLAERIIAGQRITVTSTVVAADILRRIGLNGHEVTDRLRHAGLLSKATDISDGDMR